MMRGLLLLLLVAGARAQQPVKVSVDWGRLSAPTKTTITLQVVENPPLMRGSAIHDAAWKALASLHAEKARLALWYPYPRLAVAELQAPRAGSTSWDFSHIDPVVEDFFQATAGQPSVFTMSTMPSWLFADGGKSTVPADASVAAWDYEDGTQLRDSSGKETAAYFARVASWYAAGGFTDELGRRHTSGHHYPIAYWEVLNEPEYEHQISVEQYTRLYDSVQAAVRAVSPATRFVGMSLAEPSKSPEAFAYFLDPKHHAGGATLDAISYHFYAHGEPGESADAQQYSFFAEADGFLNSVRYIDQMRRRLSPMTETHINEAGCIAATDIAQGPQHMEVTPPEEYFRLCGAVFAYLYLNVSELSVDVLGASQLLGYPSQYPSVSMLDWKTGTPNARLVALAEMMRSLGKGDRRARTTIDSGDVAAGAFVDESGRRKILLINKRRTAVEVELPGAERGRWGGGGTCAAVTGRNRVRLAGFCVGVVVDRAGE